MCLEKQTNNGWADQLKKIYSIFIDCRISVSSLCSNLCLISRVCLSWVTLWLFDILIWSTWSTLFLLYFVNLWHDFEIKDWNSCSLAVHFTVRFIQSKLFSLCIHFHILFLWLFWRMLLPVFSQPGTPFLVKLTYNHENSITTVFFIFLAGYLWLLYVYWICAISP